MIAALLLLAVGLGDLARRGARSRAQPVIGILIAGAVLAVLGWQLALPLTQLLSAGLIAVFWMLALRIGEERTPPLWPAALLLGFAAFGAAAGPWPAPADAAPPVLAMIEPDVAVVVTVLAVGVWLTTSANLVTRAMLERARGANPVPLARASSRWVLRRGRRRALVIERVDCVDADSAAGAAGALLGGRIIGPLERLLIVLLALIGAQTLIAALLAAKGIVRFPEISADRGTGSKAEEFLIGSLTSWALAALGFVLVMVAQNV